MKNGVEPAWARLNARWNAKYENIIREFPDDIKPHVELIAIALTMLRGHQLAEALYRRGMELLKEPQHRVLTAAYDRLRSFQVLSAGCSLQQQLEERTLFFQQGVNI